MATLLEEMGGLPALSAMISDFIDRVRADVMIGFHFKHADPDVLKQRETEFSARALGGTDVPYTGRSMREAHAAHMIRPGQFNRRLVILRQTMVAHQVPLHVQEALLAHAERLRAQVLQVPDACAPPPSTRPDAPAAPSPTSAKS